MSAMSERHHEQVPEPERRWTMDEWVEVRRRAAQEAWATTNLTANFDLTLRIVDAAFRATFPDRIPPEHEP